MGEGRNVPDVPGVNFEMDDEIHARAKAAAAMMGMGLYEFIELATAEKVERAETERKAREAARRERRPGRT